MNIKKEVNCKGHSRFQMDNLGKLMPISKRSQSQIITTVLLILIGVIAAGVIMTFVIPFIKEKLQSGDCLEVVNQIEISSGYTCYDGTMQTVQIKIEDIRDLIIGFAVELGGPSSQTTKIVEGNPENVVMYDGDNFEIPNSTTSRTYNITIDTKPDYISVYPILKNSKICPVSDSVIDIEDC